MTRAPLGRLAGAEPGLAGTVDERDRHLRHLGESQDRIATPIATGDALAVERDLLVERPARGLDDAAFHLVLESVGAHDLARIRRAARLEDAHRAGRAVDLDLGR